MKAIMCDVCGKFVGEQEVRRVSMNVEEMSILLSYTKVAHDVKEICPSCYNKVSEVLTPKQTDNTGASCENTVTEGLRRHIDAYKANPEEAIAQVEYCGFETEGGTLNKNLGWIAIKELVLENQKRQSPNEDASNEAQV